MAMVEVKNNAYDFSEKTDGGSPGDTQPLITNGQGRAFLPFEIVLNSAAPFYCGEVREAGGIADTATGRININHNRVIRTNQFSGTIAAGVEVYFQPGGAGAAGAIVPIAGKSAGSIKFGRCEGVGTGWVEIRPYAFSDVRILEI